MQIQRQILTVVALVLAGASVFGADPVDYIAIYRGAHEKFVKTLEPFAVQIESAKGRPREQKTALESLKKNLEELEDSADLVMKRLAQNYDDALTPVYETFEGKWSSARSRCQTLQDKLDFQNAKRASVDEEDVFAARLADAVCAPSK